MSGDSNTQITLPALRQLDPYDFEYLVADLWEEQGYTTTVTDGSNDRGIDVVATKERPVSEKHLIQVKRYAGDNRIGSPEVRKYATLYQQEPDADKVIIVTTSTFTDEATTVAQKLDVELKNGVEVRGLVTDQNSDLIGEYFPQKKETTQTRNTKYDITETGKTETESSTTNKETTSQKSSRQEYIKKQSSTDIQTSASSDNRTTTSTGTSSGNNTSNSHDRTLEETVEMFSKAGIWLIRLVCVGLILLSGFGIVIFSLDSLIFLRLHPQLLPSIGLLSLSLAVWGVAEMSYEKQGLLFAILSLILLSIVYTVVFAVLESLGMVN